MNTESSCVQWNPAYQIKKNADAMEGIKKILGPWMKRQGIDFEEDETQPSRKTTSPRSNKQHRTDQEDGKS